MAEYKIESQEQLLEKLNEEIEVLNSIFDGEGVVLQAPTIVVCNDADAATADSGKSNEEDELSAY
jgi:hypothetical protein